MLVPSFERRIGSRFTFMIALVLEQQYEKICDLTVFSVEV